MSLDSLLAELAKLRRIRALGLPADMFHDVVPKAVEAYRQRAAAEPPSELRRHEPPTRALLMGALCFSRGREITDSLVDLLIDLVHRIGARGIGMQRRQLASRATTGAERRTRNSGRHLAAERTHLGRVAGRPREEHQLVRRSLAVV